MNETETKIKISELILDLSALIGVSATADFISRTVTVWITKSGDSNIILNSAIVKIIQDLGYVLNVVFH
jgi:hypothetical protein